MYVKLKVLTSGLWKCINLYIISHLWYVLLHSRAKDLQIFCHSTCVHRPSIHKNKISPEPSGVLMPNFWDSYTCSPCLQTIFCLPKFYILRWFFLQVCFGFPNMGPWWEEKFQMTSLKVHNRFNHKRSCTQKGGSLPKLWKDSSHYGIIQCNCLKRIASGTKWTEICRKMGAQV